MAPFERRPAAAPARPRLSAPAAALAALLSWSCTGEPEPPYHPNVLLIVVDATRADRLGVNGYPLPVTPHIDRLAAEGVNFRAAMAPATWTKPSMATLMTSVYPSQHGLRLVAVEGDDGFYAHALRDDLVTLAERFQAAGYATVGIFNQVHLKPRFGFGQGFGTYWGHRGRAGFFLNGRLADWLERPRPGPFFAFLHYLDPHWPYDHAVAEDRGRFGPTATAEPPPESPREAVESWGRRASAEDLAALQARYDQEVAFADRAVGQMVDHLRERGLYDDTVVVVTSDHGESFRERGRMQHGTAPFEELIRVPLVVRVPERLSDFRGAVDEPVGLIDLMPTLLELADLEPEPQAEGESVAPLVAGEAARPRVVFVETREAFVARGRTEKLFLHEDGRLELFDLAADPGELDPRPCEGPCRELARRLRSFRDLMLEARQRAPGEARRLSDEEMETLRSLGYVD